jgi:DNA-binding CsgD family transcriptional regulator
MSDIHDLSEREIEILQLVATGASNKQIAKKLYISTNTVKVHLRNIFTKIDAASRTEAAMYAVRLGLVETPSDGSETKEDSNVFTQVSTVEPVPRSLRLYLLAGLAVVLVVVIIGVSFTRSREPSLVAATSIPVITVLPTPVPRWDVLTDMPTAREGLAAAAYENQIYTIGGKTNEGVTGLVERFDPEENTWEESAPKPTPVTDISASVIGGLIYIPGGRMSSGAVSDDLSVYNPRTNRWSQAAKLPVALSAYALTTFEGKLYLFGGWDGQQYVASTYLYDPDLNEWSEGTPMREVRGFAGAAVSGGKIYVIGGYDGTQLLSTTEVYLPDQENSDAGSVWESGVPLPSPRYAMGVTSIADIIHVIGGKGTGDSPLPVLVYLQQDGNWQELESDRSKSYSHIGLVPLGAHLYVIGGSLNDKPTAKMYSYQAIYTILVPIVQP